MLEVKSFIMNVEKSKTIRGQNLSEFYKLGHKSITITRTVNNFFYFAETYICNNCRKSARFHNDGGHKLKGHLAIFKCVPDFKNPNR